MLRLIQPLAIYQSTLVLSFTCTSSILAAMEIFRGKEVSKSKQIAQKTIYAALKS